MTPPGSDIQQQAQLHQRPQHSLKAHATNGLPRPGTANGVMKAPLSATGLVGGPNAAYYNAGPFQNHIEQLGKLTRPFFSCFVSSNPWF